jgi:hypothetical protein
VEVQAVLDYNLALAEQQLTMQAEAEAALTKERMLAQEA